MTDVPFATYWSHKNILKSFINQETSLHLEQLFQVWYNMCNLDGV